MLHCAMHIIQILLCVFRQALARLLHVLLTTPRPHFECTDVRCDRARFYFIPPHAPLVEGKEHQIAVSVSSSGDAPAEDGHVLEWRTDGWTPNSTRLMPGLVPCTSYKVRCRMRCWKGISAWTDPITVRTLQRPLQSGGSGPGFTWAQTEREVSIRMPVPGTLTSKNIEVKLRPKHLSCSHHTSRQSVQLQSGELAETVQRLTPDGGSYWELDRQADALHLVVVLEKAKCATNIKWGFWRSVFADGREVEIDTHAISEEAMEKQPVQAASNMLGMQKATVQELLTMRERVSRTKCKAG
jgi:CS domain